MPYCKNNPKRTYKGDEPSPKGLGYCASGEKEGKRMKGKDGNIWIKKNGKWIKIDSYVGYKNYLIRWNGGLCFEVYIKDKNVIIFSIDEETEEKDKKVFDKKVKKVYIGKSPKCDMTKFSGGIGKRFDGNTILLEVKPKEYIFISSTLIKFKTNDEIIKFVSPMGNSGVPYPYAIGNENIYFLNLEKYIPKEYYKKSLNNPDIIVDFGLLYDNFMSIIGKPLNKKGLEEMDKFNKIINSKKEDLTIKDLKFVAKKINVSVSGSKENMIKQIYNVRHIVIE